MNATRELVQRLVKSAASAEAFLIISSIEIQIALRHQKRQQLSKRQLGHRMDKCPNARDFCDATKAGGLQAARELAIPFMQAPQMIWWCDSETELKAALTHVYQRFDALGSRDGYELGCCKQLGWIVIWCD